MNRILLSLLYLFACVNFTSCEKETPHMRAAQGNIKYLHQLITRSDEAREVFHSMISKGNVVVDFYADWCGPCKYLSQSIETIAKQFPNVTFLKVDTDQFKDVSSGVRSIPVLKLYRNGQVVYSNVGALSATELSKLLKKHF